MCCRHYNVCKSDELSGLVSVAPDMPAKIVFACRALTRCHKKFSICSFHARVAKISSLNLPQFCHLLSLAVLVSHRLSDYFSVHTRQLVGFKQSPRDAAQEAKQ